jgi:uncharacterized protein with HEPN domain
MAHRGPLLRLHDIVEFVDAVASYTAGVEYRAYIGNAILRDAIERNIEKISEASRNIPDELKGDYPTIPWREIAGIGNVIRHAYDRVDDETIWNIVRLDLPELGIVAAQMIERLTADD